MRENEFEEPVDGGSGRICEFDRELLSAWIDEELDVHDERRVREHLAKCPDCSHELDALRHVNEQFSRVLVAASPMPHPAGKRANIPGGRAAGRPGWSRGIRAGIPGTRFAARVLTILVLACLVGLTGMLLLQNSPDVAEGGKLDSDRLHLAMTRVAEPLGRMVSNNDSIRTQQVQCVKTMQQELRLLNLEAKTLPENEQSRAVREEINQLLAKARRLAQENSDNLDP